jgi:hypothetical protein
MSPVNPEQVYKHVSPRDANLEEAFQRMVQYNPRKPRTVVKQTQIMKL